MVAIRLRNLGGPGHVSLSEITRSRSKPPSPRRRGRPTVDDVQEIEQRIRAAGIPVMGPICTIPPAIHSFYFFDPIGIRLEIVSDLASGEENFKLIESVRQNDDDLRRELTGLEWLVLRECQRPIQEGPYHQGPSAVVQACEAGHLAAQTDAHQMAFEIHGLILALHYEARFLKSPHALARAQQGFENTLHRYGAKLSAI